MKLLRRTLLPDINMNEKTIANWIKLADYDLDTARAMMNAGKYLYVAFTCQQAMEKIIKAIYVSEKSETPPYTHSLLKLIREVGLYDKLDEDTRNFIGELNAYYIESRYTEELDEINAELTNKKAGEILSKTNEVFGWLKSKTEMK
jgi:HEPN domain-containing protein